MGLFLKCTASWNSGIYIIILNLNRFFNINLYFLKQLKNKDTTKGLAIELQIPEISGTIHFIGFTLGMYIAKGQRQYRVKLGGMGGQLQGSVEQPCSSITVQVTFTVSDRKLQPSTALSL